MEAGLRSPTMYLRGCKTEVVTGSRPSPNSTMKFKTNRPHLISMYDTNVCVCVCELSLQIDNDNEKMLFQTKKNTNLYGVYTLVDYERSSDLRIPSNNYYMCIVSFLCIFMNANGGALLPNHRFAVIVP